MDQKRAEILNRMTSEYKECSGLDAKWFCFDRMLDQFGLKITEEQFSRIYSVLTLEQLNQVEKGLDERQKADYPNLNWF